jgi:hypothetical protein
VSGIHLALARVRAHRFYVIIELRQMLFTNPSHLFHDFIFVHSSFSHQFFRRANNGAGKASFQARGFNDGGHLGIGDVRAVPGQQKVHSMNCGKGYMDGGRRRLLRQRQRVLQQLGEINSFFGNVQDWGTRTGAVVPEY